MQVKDLHETVHVTQELKFLRVVFNGIFLMNMRQPHTSILSGAIRLRRHTIYGLCFSIQNNCGARSLMTGH